MEASSSSSSSTQQMPMIKAQENQNAQSVAPSQEAIERLCVNTNYRVVQENGQRRYGPPSDWTGEEPGRGCEVFVGKIPRDCFEDELVPVLQTVGRIYMFRLMMEFSGCNRGYGFCVYTNREDTKRAVRALDGYEIRKGRSLGVCLSVDNCRLFVGGIPKNKTKQDIFDEMTRVTDGVRDVIVYPSAANKEKNRGFAFVEYEHHKAAAMARRKLLPGKIQLWDQQIAVDWAEPEREVDEEIMSKVKILYVRNLMLDTTEDHLRELFGEASGCGVDCIERVKKIRDYAFVHFKEREQALTAMAAVHDTEIDGSRVEVSLAKPADKSEQARQKSSSQRQSVSQQQHQQLQQQHQHTPTMTYSLLAATGQPGVEPLAFAYCSPVIAQGPPTLSPRLMTPQQQPIASLMLPQFDSPTNTRGQAAAATTANASTAAVSAAGGVRQGRVYRNAAGSRSAGGGSARLASKERKGLVEQLLDDVCSKSGLEQPTYLVQSHRLIDPTTGQQSNWLLGKVTVSGTIGVRQFTASRFAQSTDEARALAAESALGYLCHLPYQLTDFAGHAFLPGSPLLPLAVTSSQFPPPQLLSQQPHAGSPELTGLPTVVYAGIEPSNQLSNGVGNHLSLLPTGGAGAAFSRPAVSVAGNEVYGNYGN